MFKGNPHLSCYLSHIGVDFSIDLPAEAIPEDVINYYRAEKKVYRPHTCFGFHVDYDVTVYCVGVVKLPNGKFAFPVYEITPYFEDDEPWKSREGDMILVGWCVRDNDPFAKYKE